MFKVPTVFFLLKFRIVDYVSAEIMFCLADILAKVVLTLLLSNATIEQSQIEKVDDLVNIASEMERALTNSDALLEKMMPKSAVEQLKRGEVPGTEEYESVTYVSTSPSLTKLLSILASSFRIFQILLPFQQ